LSSLIIIAYFSEASVNYWVTPYVIKQVDNRWYSSEFFNSTGSSGSFVKLSVANKGLLDASFDVNVQSTNAYFAETPFEGAQLIDSRHLKLPYTLKAGQEVNTNINFVIENSTKSFELTVSFEPNQWFIRSTESNWGGQSSFRYSLAENYTWIASMIN
jgi:hypothetical protein